MRRFNSKLTIYILCTLFVGAITLSLVRIIFASAPNPGHTWSELGDVAVTVAQGGTGVAALTANNVIIGNGTSGVTFVAPSSDGNLLRAHGGAWSSATPTSTRILFSSRTVSLTASTVCHPTAGTCGTSDRTMGVELPFAGTIQNLRAYMTTAPANGNTCAFTINKATNCSGAFSATALTCSIVGNGALVTCQDSSNKVAVAASDCLQMAFTETGTCTGIDTWIFEMKY